MRNRRSTPDSTKREHGGATPSNARLRLASIGTEPRLIRSAASALATDDREVTATAVGSVAEFLETVDVGALDCVVTAVDLSDGTWRDLTRELGERDANPSLLLFGSELSGAEISEAYDGGVDGFVTHTGDGREFVVAREIEAHVSSADRDGDDRNEASGANRLRPERDGVERPEEAPSRRDHDREREAPSDGRPGKRADGTSSAGDGSAGAGEGSGPVRPVGDHRRLESETNEIFGRITDAFVGLDEEWRVTYLNSRAADLLLPGERTVENVVGTSIWDAFPEVVGTAFETEYRKAAETAEPTTFEEYFPPLDVWFEVHAYPSETGLSVYFRDVTERKEMTTELRQRERSLRTLYDITSNRDLSFDEKVAELLDAGCERLDVDIGFLSRISNDRFEIVESSGSHEHLQPGSMSPLDETYCRQVIEVEEPVVVQDAEADGWYGDPGYERYGLECYLGTRVDVDGDCYGTFCFASTSSRKTTFSDAEQTFVELMGEWVSHELERRNHEDQLAAMHEATRTLVDAETATEVAERAIEATESLLGIEFASIALYDEESDVIERTVRSERMRRAGRAGRLFDPNGDVAWRAFIRNETTPLDADAVGPGPVERGAVVPLGNHGLIAVGTTDLDGVSRTTLDLVKILAANVDTALERVEREEELQDRERLLADQNDRLERVNRINDVIRQIDQALVEASTREEIEEAVCRELAVFGPYRMAWMGKLGTIGDTIVPRQWAGVEKGYFDDIAIDDQDAFPADGPSGAAIQTREPQVVQNILRDASFQPWREQALNRGYRAAVSTPLVYGDSLYGVLGVYADQPGQFSDLEVQVLAELGETIGHAINAVESKRALVGDTVTELEYRVTDSSVSFIEAMERVDGEYTFQSVVPQVDGTLRLFFNVRSASVEDVLGFASGSSKLREVDPIDEQEGEATYQATLAGDSLTALLLDHGAVPQAMYGDASGGRIVVRIPHDADARTFTEMLQTKYGGIQLVASRERDRTVKTEQGFRAALRDRLTERQQEVLQTAYFSGFFETPRKRTGTEIGDSLGISQPTFNTHLRVATRKLVSLLIDDETDRV